MYALKIKTCYHVRVEIIKNKKRRGKNAAPKTEIYK